jgi:glutamate synthase (NADPH/NADH) large chain
MTGGRAVILGSTGRNFAAGMSGGIAYVYDPDEAFIAKVNLELVEVDQVQAAVDLAELKAMIQTHTDLTESTVGRRILDDWDNESVRFKKVIPTMYRQVLEQRAEEANQDSNPPAATAAS